MIQTYSNNNSGYDSINVKLWPLLFYKPAKSTIAIATINFYGCFCSEYYIKDESDRIMDDICETISHN